MAARWPAGTACTRLVRDVEDRSCPVWDCYRHGCDHRSHQLWPLAGPTQVGHHRVRCPDPAGESRGRTGSPATALSLRMPRGCRGWEVWCWLGQRRFARHGSVPQLRAAGQDGPQIPWSDEAIAPSMALYHPMLAARQPDPARLADDSRAIAGCVLTIDGLQPDKGPAP